MIMNFALVYQRYFLDFSTFLMRANFLVEVKEWQRQQSATVNLQPVSNSLEASI